MVRVRLAVLLAGAALLAACNTLSSENESQLALYLENAAQYYDGGHYERAYQQWDQALLLDAENEKARLGQAMALYQLGRKESAEAIGPLSEGTKRLDALRLEDFGGDQWKVDLGAALVHERWCEIYDRKLRKIAEDEAAGVTPDADTLAIIEARVRDAHARRAGRVRERARRLGEGPARPPHVLAGTRADRRVARRPAREPAYANLYLEQVLRSKQLWKDASTRFPKEAPIFEAKLAGAAMQEAELRDLMGAVLYKLGRMKEAEEQVDVVLKTYPQRATAYLNPRHSPADARRGRPGAQRLPEVPLLHRASRRRSVDPRVHTAARRGRGAAQGPGRDGPRGDPAGGPEVRPAPARRAKGTLDSRG
jgi:tetratricopeptide (TPR) repeat protein